LPDNLGTDIEKAAGVVRDGGVIVFPTDTLYGLGADPQQAEPVRKLVAIKGRADGKGLPILLARPEDAGQLVTRNSLLDDLASAFWPGALTIVMKAREPVDARLAGPGGTLGLRVPGSTTTRRLVELAGSFLIGTSANRSGQPPAVTAAEAYDTLGDLVDYVFDGGPVSGVASTVLDIDADPPTILRSGAISAEQLRRVAPTVIGENEP
jgi:L-threonylcarbamoyladenylate synthase